MKKRTVLWLTLAYLLMALLIPFLVPSGKVTPQAAARYMDAIPLDDEYAFLYE